MPVPADAPAGLKKMHKSVYDKCIAKDGNTEKHCSEVAWGAVKRGYAKNAKGKWVKKTNANERFVTKLGEPKDWITLMPYGDWKSRGIKVTKKVVQSIVDNFRKNVLDYKVPINVDHDDTLGSRGSIVDVRVGDGGLEAKPAYTAIGQQEIEDDMWPYSSAEFDDDYEVKESGEKVGPTLVGMGLVLRPYLGANTAVYNEGTGEYESFDEHLKPELAAVVEAVNALIKAYNGKGEDDEEGTHHKPEDDEDYVEAVIAGDIKRVLKLRIPTYALEQVLGALSYIEGEVEWMEDLDVGDMTPYQTRLLPLYRNAVAPLKAIVAQYVAELGESGRGGDVGKPMGLAYDLIFDRLIKAEVQS